MSSEWTRTTIGAQATLQRGFDITKAAQRPGSVPVVSSAGISSWHDSAMVKAPGVVLGRKGVVGSVHYVSTDFWPHDTSLWVKDFHGNDPRFVYYFFVGHADDLRALDVGSANPTLNRNHVHPIEVNWPPLIEQVEIAIFLGLIDDRIALLRETNATLEAIAQALFKSWFVDFDPVYAKQQGIAPAGMDDATAALFPDGFEESALGLVPKGWPILTIGDIAQRIGMGPFGSDIKVSTFLPKGVPVLNGKNVQGLLLDDGCANFIAESHADRLNKSCVQAGDIVVTHRGTLGQVSLVPEGLAYEKFVASQSQFFLRCDLKKSTPEWATYFLKSPVGQHLLLANTSQVGVPSIARPVTHLKSIKVAVAPIELIGRFSDLVGSLHVHMVSNRLREKTLATLRDTLLPRLISGQLRLPEAEEQLAEAIA